MSQPSRYYTVFYSCVSNLSITTAHGMCGVKASIESTIYHSTVKVDGPTSEGDYVTLYNYVKQLGQKLHPTRMVRIDCIVDHGKTDPSNETEEKDKRYTFEVIAETAKGMSQQEGFVVRLEGNRRHYHGTNEFFDRVRKEIVGQLDAGVIIKAVRRIESF